MILKKGARVIALGVKLFRDKKCLQKTKSKATRV